MSLFREACKGRVLVKRSRASGLTVETQRDFGLGATGLRLLALPGLLKTLARTGPTVEKTPKHLASSLISTQNTIAILLLPPHRKFYPRSFYSSAPRKLVDMVWDLGKGINGERSIG